MFNIDTSKKTFRKSEDLFAIRQFLKEVPEIKDLIFNDNIKKLSKKFWRPVFCGKKYLF
jgi:hypothetical protein